MALIRGRLSACVFAAILALAVIGTSAQIRITRNTGVGSQDVSATASPTFAGLTTAAAGTDCWAGRSCLSSPADGQILMTNNAGTDFARLQFGGTTSAFPALKRNGALLQIRLADDSGPATLSGNFAVSTSLSSTTAIYNATAPTVLSGFGTSPTIPFANGTAGFTVNVGTGGVATSGVLTLNGTPTNGWACSVNNITAKAAHRADQTVQIASSTTSVTVENQTLSTGAAVAWGASDVLRLNCFGY